VRMHLKKMAISPFRTNRANQRSSHIFCEICRIECPERYVNLARENHRRLPSPWVCTFWLGSCARDFVSHHLENDTIPSRSIRNDKSILITPHTAAENPILNLPWRLK
jgi:hypothetical protein